MSKPKITPVDHELTFSRDEIIVSKTDATGKIIYANDVFCRLAEMRTGEVLGYHSNCRSPNRAAVQEIIPLYRELKAEAFLSELRK